MANRGDQRVESSHAARSRSPRVESIHQADIRSRGVAQLSLVQTTRAQLFRVRELLHTNASTLRQEVLQRGQIRVGLQVSQLPRANFKRANGCHARELGNR